jgi:uncharacterized iron-regulated membrane protein
VITVDDAGALAAAVKVTVALQVGLQGLFVNAEAATPVGSVVRMLNVTGEVVADAFKVAVAVSTPPAAPSVMLRLAGLAASVKSKNPETTRVNVAVCVLTGVPPVACMVITVEDAGALAAAVNVTVALHVGLHGLLENAEAVTPVGIAVRILKVTGDVVAEAFRVAVAVSTPPAAPSVIDNDAGLAASVKSKNPETTKVKVAGWVTTGEPPDAWIVINVDEAGAFEAAVNVTVAIHVGLQGLFENTEAVTPAGNVVRILNVTGEGVPEVRVAVAVSTPPAAPSVIGKLDGEAARVKLKPS